MSIYSGFATRQQQELYNSYLLALLRNMHRRLLNFYKNQTSDQPKFVLNLKKLHANMSKMEKYKYLEPKFAPLFQQLLEFLQSDYPKPGLFSQHQKCNNPKSETILSIPQSQIQPLIQHASKYTSNNIIKQVSPQELQIVKTLNTETEKKIIKDTKNYTEIKKRQLSCNLSLKSQSKSQASNKNYDTLNITAYHNYNTPDIDHDKNSFQKIPHDLPDNSHMNHLFQLVDSHRSQNQTVQQPNHRNFKYFAKSSAIKLDDVGHKNQTIQKAMQNQKDKKKSSSLNKAQKYYLRVYHRHKKQMESVFKQMSKDYIAMK